MLGTLFDAGHAGFGDQINGAMNQMWNVNRANQDASVAMSAIGARGGGMPQAPAQPSNTQIGAPGVDHTISPGGQFGRNLSMQRAQASSDANIRSNNSYRGMIDFMQKARQPEYQPFLSSLFGFGGGLGSQGATGILPTQFTTNYGASGSVTNPTTQPPQTPYSLPNIFLR